MANIYTNLGKCIYCEGEFGSIVTENGFPLVKTNDHIIPKSKGGANRMLNKTHACKDCNSLKGGSTPEEFTEKLYNMIGAIMNGQGKNKKKYPIDRLRIILKNNNIIIDQIAKYKHKLTVKPKKSQTNYQADEPSKKTLKEIVKELGFFDNPATMKNYIDDITLK